MIKSNRLGETPRQEYEPEEDSNPIVFWLGSLLYDWVGARVQLVGGNEVEPDKKCINSTVIGT